MRRLVHVIDKYFNIVNDIFNYYFAYIPFACKALKGIVLQCSNHSFVASKTSIKH